MTITAYRVTTPKGIWHGEAFPAAEAEAPYANRPEEERHIDAMWRGAASAYGAEACRIQVEIDGEWRDEEATSSEAAMRAAVRRGVLMGAKQKLEPPRGLTEDLVAFGMAVVVYRRDGDGTVTAERVDPTHVTIWESLPPGDPAATGGK